MEKEKKKPLLTPVLKLFMGTMVLANVAGGMYGAILALYLQELGADISNIGLFFALGSVIPLAFQIFGGYISDSIGRLQAIAIGSLGGVAGYIFFIFAPSWEWLLLAMVGNSIATSFVGPSFQAFIAEQSTEETRGRVYGITSAIFGVVGVIGPIAGSYLAQGISFRVMFMIAGAMYATAAVIRILMARNANKEAAEAQTEPREKMSFDGLKSNLKTMSTMLIAGGLITWIFISDGVRDIAFGMVSGLFSVFMENIRGMTIVQIGWLNALSSATAILFMTPGGWLADKKGERVGIVTGFAIICFGWLGFLYARTFGAFVAAWMVFGAGQALIGPAYSSLISKAIPEKLRGTAFGFFYSSLGIISLPAPVIGAFLWERFDPIVPFWVPLVGMVAVMPIMWIKFKLPEKEQEVIENEEDLQPTAIAAD